LSRLIVSLSIALLVINVIGMAIALFPAIAPPIAAWVDPDYYYSIDGPVEIDQAVYRPCDTVRISFNRRSRLAVKADLHRILLRQEGEVRLQVNEQIAKDVILDQSTEKIAVLYVLPCDLDPGKYYVSRVLFYEVNGDKRSYQYWTPSFEVIDD
jgi:hypothetical protein